MSYTVSTDNKLYTQSSIYSENDNNPIDTSSKSLSEKINLYDRKLLEIKKKSEKFRNENERLKMTDNASVSLINLKLDEMTKKMKNEIFRINEESRRHNESQTTEIKKIESQIKYIDDRCKDFSKKLKECLERVQSLESGFGTSNSN